ncbi:hypothetical protein MJM04_31640, partial [Salmonella enterica subsp. enterica serovar Cerro]|nr:hypothetical protein [Salmonella enterica subsp. enterica serovar Cerro]
YDEIKEKALSWSLGRAEAHEIDELNILHATMLAMQRAVAGLHRTFSVGIAGNLATRLGTGCVPFLMPLMLQVGFGYPALIAGCM